MSMEKPQEGMECRGQEESDAEGGRLLDLQVLLGIGRL